MYPFGEAKTSSSLQKSALAIDLPHFLLIIAEAAIPSICWWILHTPRRYWWCPAEPTELRQVSQL